MPWRILAFKEGKRTSEQLMIITGSMRAKKVVSRKPREEILKRVDDFTVKQVVAFPAKSRVREGCQYYET